MKYPLITLVVFTLATSVSVAQQVTPVSPAPTDASTALPGTTAKPSGTPTPEPKLQSTPTAKRDGESPLSILAISISGVTALGAFWYYRRVTHIARFTNLGPIVNVERSLAQVPKAIRFHGITDEDLKLHGIEADELAYLVANFTAGGIYHHTAMHDSIKPFPAGSYRRQMLSAEATRSAWPLVRRMMNNATPYFQALELTKTEIEEELRKSHQNA